MKISKMPWKSDENGIINDAEGNHVASVTPKNRKVNSALIEASAEMFFLLKRVSNCRTTEAWGNLRGEAELMLRKIEERAG